jgi:hypothetical protein
VCDFCKFNLTTKKATYELTNKIVNALNEKLIVGGIFCDLSKAFDCINHDILLSKFNFYGITGNAYEWIKSYLSNRFQRVEAKNENPNYKTLSDWGVIKYGVPQASILGPLLFLLYFNDLSKTINGNSKPVLFADDISFIVISSKLEDFQKRITTEFASLNMWFKSNKLTMNFGKTYFMHFKTKNSHLTDVDVNYANKSIYKAYDTRFLGIFVDSTLHYLGKLTLKTLDKN